MVKVKICGITNLEDALGAIEAGCDALGFVFYKKSPRYITPEETRDIIKNLPKNIIKIGVFVNEKEKRIREIAKLCKLDMLQFHGSESVDFCKRFTGFKIIKAFRIKDKVDLARILRYNTFAYLFDTFVKSKAGGTGKRFDWRLLKDIKGIGRTIFLSGGLNPANVAQAIKAAHPDWLDVSSSLEKSAGIKESRLVKDFINRARGSYVTR